MHKTPAVAALAVVMGLAGCGGSSASSHATSSPREAPSVLDASVACSYLSRSAVPSQLSTAFENRVGALVEIGLAAAQSGPYKNLGDPLNNFYDDVQAVVNDSETSYQRNIAPDLSAIGGACTSDQAPTVPATGTLSDQDAAAACAVLTSDRPLPEIQSNPSALSPAVVGGAVLGVVAAQQDGSTTFGGLVSPLQKLATDINTSIFSSVNGDFTAALTACSDNHVPVLPAH